MMPLRHGNALAMNADLASLLAVIDPGPALLVLIAAALGAGLIRGFSGFGTAMAFMPLASAATNPAFALLALQIMDIIPAIPIIRKNWRNATPHELIPLAGTAALTVPLGVWILKVSDPVSVRWAVATLILLLIAMIASGWRYTRKPTLPVTVATGATAGIFGGLAALSGPPVILFWMAGQSNAARVRANMTVFLASLTFIGVASLWVADLFTIKGFLWGIIIAPAYIAGIWLGGYWFPKASESTFRRIALVFIAVSVLISLPAFDNWIR